MTEIDRDEIQSNVLKIVRRVKKNGIASEAVKIDLKLVLQGQDAINYKVIKLFAPQITDTELVELLFQLGLHNGTDILKVLAVRHGIRI